MQYSSRRVIYGFKGGIEKEIMINTQNKDDWHNFLRVLAESLYLDRLLRWINNRLLSIQSAFERLKMTNEEFKELRCKAQKYEAILSTIEIKTSEEYEDVLIHGALISRLAKNRQCNIKIDTNKILNIIGIIPSKEYVKIIGIDNAR